MTSVTIAATPCVSFTDALRSIAALLNRLDRNTEVFRYTEKMAKKLITEIFCGRRS